MLDLHHHHHSNPAPVGDHLEKKGWLIGKRCIFYGVEALGFYDPRLAKFSPKPSTPRGLVGVFKGRLQVIIFGSASLARMHQKMFFSWGTYGLEMQKTWYYVRSFLKDYAASTTASDCGKRCMVLRAHPVQRVNLRDDCKDCRGKPWHLVTQLQTLIRKHNVWLWKKQTYIYNIGLGYIIASHILPR